MNLPTHSEPPKEAETLAAMQEQYRKLQAAQTRLAEIWEACGEGEGLTPERSVRQVLREIALNAELLELKCALRAMERNDPPPARP